VRRRRCCCCCCCYADVVHGQLTGEDDLPKAHIALHGTSLRADVSDHNDERSKVEGVLRLLHFGCSVNANLSNLYRCCNGIHSTGVIYASDIRW